MSKVDVEPEETSEVEQQQQQHEEEDAPPPPEPAQTLRVKTLAESGNYFYGERRISSAKYQQAFSKINKINYKDGTFISLEALSYTVRHEKTKQPIDLLKKVTAYLEPGTLTALMGPSGAGKTTLLDVISGRKTQGTISGRLLFNGMPAERTYLQMKTSFVEQFDTLVPNLTVYEMILYQAELKCPTSLGIDEKKMRVEGLIDSLGLAVCRDVKIGDALNRGISGGQAKRTNIAIGLVTNPDVLFLDEPTTGLDSATSNGVMQITRAIADSGRTVCATIHSPTREAFRFFHSLILLVKGSLVYFGPLYGENGAAQYFEGLGFPYDFDDNLADHLIAITGGGTRGPSSNVDFPESYSTSALRSMNDSNLDALRKEFDDGDNDEDQKNNHDHKKKRMSIMQLRKESVTYVVSPLYSLYALCRYRGVADFSDYGFVLARTGDKLFEMFLLATVFARIGDNCCSQPSVQATSGALFFVATLPAFGAAGYVPTIFQERPLFYREQADGCYPVICYLLFKLVEEQLIAIGTTLIFALVVFYSVQLQGNFLHFWLTFHATLSVGILMAYNVAALVPTLDGANSALPTVNIVGLFFVGLLITRDNIPDAWSWFTYIVFNRYSWHGLMEDQFGGDENDDPKKEPQVGNEFVLDFYDVQLSKWGNFGILCSFFFLYLFTAYLSLKFVRHVKR